MDGRKILGVILIIVAIGVLAVNSSALTGLGGVLQPDGKTIACQVTFDKDSINAHTCQIGDACRTSGFGALGLFTNDVDLQMQYNGHTYADDKESVNVFGVDKTVGMTGCVPKEATQVKFVLYDNNGAILDTEPHTLQ